MFTLRKGAFVSYVSPTIVTAAIFIVHGFSKLQIQGAFKKAVALLSPLTFGVYLIHENLVFKRKFMYGQFAHYASYSIIKMLGAILLTHLIIYLSASILEFIRAKLFKILKIKKGISSIEDKIQERIIQKQEMEKQK